MNPKTLMLVDDNPDDVDLTLRALRKCQISSKVIVERDGLDALDYLFGTGRHAGRNTAEQPHVILLDIRMPRLDGLEVLHRLRADERTRCIPVVMLTSSKEERDLAESYRRGANSYIRKPVDYVEFLEVLQHLNLYWLVLNELPPFGSARTGDPS